MESSQIDISQDLNRVLDLKAETADITPTIEIKPTPNIFRFVGNATSGVQTVYTTPSDKDFYLCGFQFQMHKDAACDIGTGAQGITCVLDRDTTTRYLALQMYITLTLQNFVQSADYIYPIKLSRNSAITFTGSWTAGVCVRGCIIYGYTRETLK